MPSRPRVLLITNEAKPGDAAGQIDGYRLLQRSGELKEVGAVSWRSGYASDPAGAVQRVVSAARDYKPDIAVVWSPGRFPATRGQFDQISEALGSSMLLYWEGDSWHRGKPITEAMTWWLGASDVVFSVSGPPQATDLVQHGANDVRHTLHTYCHLQFAEQEATEPGPITSRRVVMIGSNLMSVPGITGVPGSFRRWELAFRMSRRSDFELRGAGWRRVGLRATPIAYRDQGKFIRESAMSVNWDHFPYLRDSSSDRLAISMIAGRVHITVRHPGMAWAPSQDIGLFQRDSPKEIVDLVDELAMDRDRLEVLGRESHRWAQHRMSHREAARLVMSSVVDSVAAPPADPWARLPAPLTRRT